MNQSNNNIFDGGSRFMSLKLENQPHLPLPQLKQIKYAT